MVYPIVTFPYIMKFFCIVFIQILFFGLQPLLAADSLKVGTQAPGIVLKDLSGEWVFLSTYCGKKPRKSRKDSVKYNVILNFWATYCVPCRREIPQLEKMLESYSKNTKMFLISIDSKGEKIVKPFLNKNEFKSTVLLDIYGKTAERYGVEKLPSLVLLDKEGIIRFVTYGDGGDEVLGKLAEELKKL